MSTPFISESSKVLVPRYARLLLGRRKSSPVPGDIDLISLCPSASHRAVPGRQRPTRPGRRPGRLSYRGYTVMPDAMRVKGEDMKERGGMNGERSNAGRKATATAFNAEDAEKKERTLRTTVTWLTANGERPRQRPLTQRTPRTRRTTVTWLTANGERRTTTAFNAENDVELSRRQSMIAAARRGLHGRATVGKVTGSFRSRLEQIAGARPGVRVNGKRRDPRSARCARSV